MRDVYGDQKEKEEGFLNCEDTPSRYAETLLVCRTGEAKEFPLMCTAKNGDVGYDLYTVRDTTVPAKGCRPVDVPTGVSVKVPNGFWGYIIGRSSTARKHGLDIVPGVIDTGYTGELFACCWNRNDEDFVIPKGTRVAQLVIKKVYTPEVFEVDELPRTERGATGFGSTDKK